MKKVPDHHPDDPGSNRILSISRKTNFWIVLDRYGIMVLVSFENFSIPNETS